MAQSAGGYYCWGGNNNKDPQKKHNTDIDVLTDNDDTAYKLWGSNWRMPTDEELQALLDNCDVEWTTVKGVNGRKFTGKGDYVGNSLFLPAVSYCNDGEVNTNVLRSSGTSDSLYYTFDPACTCSAHLNVCQNMQ